MLNLPLIRIRVAGFVLYLITTSICLSATDVDSVERLIDSFRTEIANEHIDQEKIALYLKLAREIQQSDRERSIPILKEGLAFSSSLQSDSLEARIIHAIGSQFLFLGKNDSAALYTNRAFSLAQELNHIELLAMTTNNRALIHQRNNEYEKAIKNYQDCISFADSLNDVIGKAYALANLMSICMDQEDHKNALTYAHSIINIEGHQTLDSKTLSELRSLYPGIYLNMGSTYTALSLLDSAELHFEKANENLKYTNNDYAKNYYSGYIESNLGEVYIKRGQQTNVEDIQASEWNYRQAKKHFQNAMNFYQLSSNERGKAMTYVNIGKANHELGYYITAESQLKSGLELAKSLQYREKIRDCYQYLAENSEKIGDPYAAYQYLKFYNTYRDSIRNEERDKATKALEVKFETAQKDNQIKELALENLLADQRRQTQQVIYLLSLLGLLGMGYTIYSRMRYKKQKELNAYERKMNQAMSRFVPTGFIQALGKDKLLDVNLGDRIEKEVTVLFTDIRSFTTLSEGMTPTENFEFVREYSERMGPIIERCNGFISQFLGDGLMAIFNGSADDAVRACIEMQEDIVQYNQLIVSRGGKPIKVGMGMHSGPLVMGIIGDEKRWDATLISDTVNTAAGIESATKRINAPILLSESCLQALVHPDLFQIEPRGHVEVKNKSYPIKVFECLSIANNSNNYISLLKHSTFDDEEKLFYLPD